MFQLMELDLISLKGTTVSNSRFWGVCGFSMSLNSPPGIGSVRHIYFCSHVKVTVSVYLHCHHSPACPWNLCLCSCPLVLPCTASQRLLSRDLCGCFLSSLALPSASWRPVWASLSPSACLLCGRACVQLLGLTGPALYIVWLVALVSAPQARPLCYRACSHVSVLCTCPLHCTLCALNSMSEFRASPGTLAGPLHLGLLWTSLGSLSLPSGWGHNPWAVYGLRSVTFYFLHSRSFVLPEIHNSPLGPLVRELPSAQESLPPSQLLPLRPKLPFRSSPSFPFLCLHLLSYLILGSLACPDPEAWGPLLSPRGC